MSTAYATSHLFPKILNLTSRQARPSVTFDSVMKKKVVRINDPYYSFCNMATLKKTNLKTVSAPDPAHKSKHQQYLKNHTRDDSLDEVTNMLVKLSLAETIIKSADLKPNK